MRHITPLWWFNLVLFVIFCFLVYVLITSGHG